MKRYRTLVLVILIISFGMNIYLGILNSSNEYRLGESSYKNIQAINIRNAKNLEILNGILESKTVNNGQLLNLYTNYKTIDESLIDVIDDYSYYKKSKILDINNKKVNNLNVLENDVYGRITIYLENILLNILNTKKVEFKIEGKTLEDFKVLDDLAKKTNESYKNLNDNKLKDLKGEDRLDKYVDNKYWIDMIDELNNINSNYNDYEFVSKIEKAKIN